MERQDIHGAITSIMEALKLQGTSRVRSKITEPHTMSSKTIRTEYEAFGEE